MSSGEQRFEAAADAIVNGDTATLQQLLHSDPELIRARSAREHHATLLHYVAANGVEEFRQRTPKNAVQVTQMLLSAGAEVDAIAGMYGGATTLGLVATSIHPKLAGLQQPLIDVLLAHGARMDHTGAAGNRHALVNGCLANGRGEAAVFLASRGAPLDLEGAAGVGRLDLVKSFFNQDGSLKPSAASEQMKRGFNWACEYGRTHVVEFLLDRGVQVGDGLHWASFSGELEIMEMLLKQNAPVDVKDERFGATPLGWALYAWSNQPQTAPPDRHCQVAARLVAAGAKPEPNWLADEKIRADPKMFAALTVP